MIKYLWYFVFSTKVLLNCIQILSIELPVFKIKNLKESKRVVLVLNLMKNIFSAKKNYDKFYCTPWGKANN